MIAICDRIATDYASQGLKLTIRQLYYQLVAGNHIPNTVRSYDNIVQLMTNARMSGHIDWDVIEDRTRGLLELSHWRNGSHILDVVSKTYHQDMWAAQEKRVFVIVEKEALAGVLERTCNEYDVPLLPARGYPSATTLRELAKSRIMRATQQIVVLHLGDHDPSGIDMTRDLEDRLSIFSRYRVHVDFRRIALNMDQIEEQQPPPNPAKQTDCRFAKYEEEFGTDQSWELDALKPQYLHELLSEQIRDCIDFDAWEKTEDEIAEVKKRLAKLAQDFDKENDDE